MKNQSILWLVCFTLILVPVRAHSAGEPTNAKEAAAQKAEKAKQDEITNKKFATWKAGLPAEQQEWETVLEENLGGFYLPIYKRAKVKGGATAWDFVKDDPSLPRVLLIGDSVSRGYTAATRKALAGKANVHRAPENCGPTATALKKLDVWLGKGDWDVIHFNFGIHDRRTPLADYETRLNTIIELLKKRGKTLIWASTTPIPEDWQDDAKWAKSIVERNRVAAKVMKEQGIVVDDLYALMLPKLAEFQNSKDVHFKGSGYTVLGGQVAKSIAAQLPSSVKFKYKDVKPQRYHLAARASKLDSRTKEYPEIGFVFGDDKKPLDLENAIVDTSVASRGKLVIWMMGHNSRLFERLADYGLHAVQIAYAKQWFGKVCLEKLVQSKEPFENSRRLITDFDVKGDVRRAHSSVQPGGSAWKDAEGNFKHEAVWRYLFTQLVEKVGKAMPLDASCDKEQK